MMTAVVETGSKLRWEAVLWISFFIRAELTENATYDLRGTNLECDISPNANCNSFNAVHEKEMGKHVLAKVFAYDMFGGSTFIVDKRGQKEAESSQDLIWAIYRGPQYTSSRYRPAQVIRLRLG